MGIEKMETRYVPAAELRVDAAADGQPAKIVGYAAVFDSLSQDLGGFRERIRSGCFTRSLRDGADVRALINHNPDLVLGRSSAGTLRMKPNMKGLLTEINPPDTSYARDLMESIRRGDVSGMSFGFRTVADQWHVEDGASVRELLDVDLFDVSAVTYPAYPQTELGLRSLQAWREDRGAVPYEATPPLDSDTWDGAAAEARVRSWASDGGQIDFAKYRRAFAWYDAEKADTVGAYKLPHHDIKSGGLVTHRRGVIAAMTALLGGRGGTSIPDSDRKPVYNHLAKHYKQFDMDPPEFHAAELAADAQLAIARRRLRLALD